MRRPRVPLTSARAAALAACAVLGFGALTASAGAVDTSETYSDPAGDSGAGPDIVEVTLASSGGTLAVEVRVPNRVTLDANEEVALYLDTDRNPSTGAFFGVDYFFQVLNGVRMRRADGSAYVDYAPASFTGSFSDGVFRASVDLVDIGAPELFDMFTWSWRAVVTDFVPDQGKLTFDMRDSDDDGVADGQDACFKVPGGRWDTNDNGCPGPFPDVPRPVLAYRWLAVPGGVRLTKATLDPVPNGAKVVAQSGGVRQTLTKRPGHPAALGRFVGRVIDFGDVLTVTITKAGWVGWVGKYRLTQGRELRRFSERCIPPGGGSPRACSAIDHGS
jgi:hypothetical protein